MREQRVIWAAIVMSTVIYFVIAYTQAPNPPRPFEESVRAPITLAMYGAAFAAFVAGLVLPSFLQSPSRTKMVITMSVFEACAIFGLLAAFLQQDWHVYVPAWILALAGFIRAFPKDEQVPA